RRGEAASVAPAGSNRSAGPLSRAVDLGAALVVAFSAWRAAGRDRAASARAEAAHAARRARVAEVAEVRRREAAQRGPANPWDRAFDRIDAVQRRFRPLAFAYGVLKKFGDDWAGRMAALIAYYAFFSIFPLMLVLV